ncbi:MAG: PKD domain-containing protein [Candidatus Cloacimonetes bacterium]|nr:PKD domain-containing protein [Candidatus Cloacimonadota bacterium]
MKKIFIGIVLLFPFVLSSTIINIPDDQPTIQAGINVSVEGDTVLVQPGTYYENINYNGHNIVLGSLFLITADSMYISNTIIDGNMNGSVITFFNGEDTTAVLIGFTIRNGLADYLWGHHFGGGIFCAFANPTINNLIITNNYAEPDGAGGGISLSAANPIITDVIIQQNFSSGVSGGLHISSNSNPIITNVIIKENVADWGGGIYVYDNCIPILTNVELTNNTAYSEGGGIICHIGCNPIMQNLTVSGNYSPSGAGIFVGTNCNPEIINSIFWNNDSSEIYVSGGSVTITYSDIQGGWAGTGNINEDPLFIDPFNYDFHLTEDSPCIDAGDPNSPLDPDDTIADMGAYYFHHEYQLSADFLGEPLSGIVPLEIQFTDLSTGNIIEWEWDFNDDGIIDSYLQNPSFTFNVAGVYTVALTVNDGEDEITEIKTDYITVFDSLLADFEGSPINGEFPLEVQFTDLSTGNITGYMWDFDNDGMIDSNEPDPLFVYEQIGSYDVSLTITDGFDENTEIKFNYITVVDTTSLNNNIYPFQTKLNQNYPNPFNPTTTISFEIKENETGILTLFNIKGQIIESHQFESGKHDYLWNASNEASGIYFCKLQTQTITETRKMLLLK